MHKFLSTIAAAACAAAFIASVALYRNDRAARAPVENYVARFEVGKRRPEVVKTIGFAPAADWAADIAADAALRDAYESVDLAHAPNDVREAWLRAMTRLPEELKASRDLLLASIRARPGWPFHQSLLGQVVLTEDTRDLRPELVSQSTRWSTPLMTAAGAAPAALSVWQALAAGYVATWPQLRDVHRATSATVFQHAFADPDFVRLTFPSFASVVGPETAVANLPESAQSLLVASDHFASTNELSFAWQLRRRWERAEWEERVADLDDIERHVRRGDLNDAQRLCGSWFDDHSVWDFDTPEAHAQAATLVSVCSARTAGTWRTDRVADAIRYLMTRNEDTTRYAEVLLPASETFRDIPPPMLAELRLMAGDVAGAEQIARSADDAGSLEWSSYLMLLASRYVASERFDEAGATLLRLSPAAQQMNEARLIRDDVERRRRNTSDRLPSPPWSRCGAEIRVSVPGRQNIGIHLQSESPAIVDLGMNDARSTTLFVNRSASVEFRLVGDRDETFWLKRVAGDSPVCASSN
ncbi:MAG TPA: hypothetical protein VL284_03875 [Thermoanaerobaculia bacterium]|nr:hypothetical protein [Thermoanaerobaculia bacterium]